ncbi:MAG: cache domain-containing protein [Rhodospirillaceae bacterium]
MPFIVLRAVAVVFMLVLAGPAVSAELGTAAEAQALVERAITFYDKVGRETALKEFSNKQGQFVDRDLYVMASEMSGLFLAHGANPGLIGKNITDLKDVNGKLIGAELVNSAKTHPDGGWVDYTWTHPVTKKLAPKRTWVKAHDGIFFGAGTYEAKTP